MKPETALVWDPIKKELDRLGWHYQRFEDKLSPGIPDLNICIPAMCRICGSQEWWLELKWLASLPEKLGSTPVVVGLRKEQRLWLRAAARAGRNCAVVCRVAGMWWVWPVKSEADADTLYEGKRWSVLRSIGHQAQSPEHLMGRLSQGLF